MNLNALFRLFFFINTIDLTTFLSLFTIVWAIFVSAFYGLCLSFGMISPI
jgi:hypothetical protein